MKTRTEQILKVMNVLTWIAFIGLMIEAGSILVSYGVCLVNPEGIRNLYKGLDLYKLWQFDFWHYTLTVAFMVALAILKAYVAHLVIKILSIIKLSNPFTMEISDILERISYFVLGIWAIGMLHNAHTEWLLKRVTGISEDAVSGESILIAGIVFIMSQIFKKGVEIQSENDLTV